MRKVNLRKLFLGDARPVVAHGQRAAVLGFLYAEGNGAALGGVLYRVVAQDAHDLLQHSAVGLNLHILVGQSLEKLAHGRTTLTIAHRLTTIKDYDRILMLGEEGIVEQGTHAQLLEKQGVYYRLWNQLPAEDEE